MNTQQTAQTFSRIVAVTIVIFIAIVAIGLLIPLDHVHAQNAGVVGIQAQMIPVFSAATNTASSSVFVDQGQALNILFFCGQGAGFTGSIDLEWTPYPNLASPTYYPLVSASYTNLFTCHSLQLGGYWPNLRSTVTFSASGGGQALSAWYTSSAGPVSFAPPAIGSNGATSPVSCDQNATVSVANGATQWVGISPSLIGGLNAVVICGFSYSFNGATSAGSLAFQWSTNNACTGLDASVLTLFTTSASPQTQAVPIPLRSSNPGKQFLCVTSSAGAITQINLSFAELANGFGQ